VTVTLGLQPISLDVALPSDGDFVAALVADQPWPAGVTIELRFSVPEQASVVWTATIAGARASWDVPAAQVQVLADRDPTGVRLRYRDPDGSVLPWGRGRVFTV
jgi:hypothetical protein